MAQQFLPISAIHARLLRTANFEVEVLNAITPFKSLWVHSRFCSECMGLID
ncbi:hypothetical protein Sjap_019845 [Stephania japonica]|uniref:Uncharacterized protein n=1 Tax=Stephania japonica TaxID=461633 RepID=A0AAP0EZJ3_9MAGN